jgi:hypothetical protein
MSDEQDPRLGKDVIAKNGTFAGVVSEISQDGRFTIVGYSCLTEKYGSVFAVRPTEVVAIFQGDEHLFGK